MRKILAVSLYATMALLGGCTTIDGSQVTLDRFGPVEPNNDESNTRAGTTEPLYAIFKAKADASKTAAMATSYSASADATAAQAFFVAGADLIKQNCDDYFNSTGKIERRLLFGRDITMFTGALATTIAAATHGGTGTVTGIALGTTSAVGANDSFRSELTFGAQYTDSVHKMVLSNLQTMVTAQTGKDLSKYTYGLAIADLRDLQDVCLPAQIVTNVKSAISNGQFTAIDITQPSSSPPAQTPPPAADAAKQAPPSPDTQTNAHTAKLALLAALPNDARVQALLPELAKLEAGKPATPPSQPKGTGQVAADHRIRLVPVVPSN